MERSARLVRIALAGLPDTPEPWIRGAADVAAAVGRSGVGSAWDEGAHAVGGARGSSGRELAVADAVERAQEGSGREGTRAVAGKDKGVHAAGPNQLLTAQDNPRHRGTTDEGDCVGSGLKHHAAGPGRRLSLAASLRSEANGSPAATPCSPLGQGKRVASKMKEAAGSHAAGPGRVLSLTAALVFKGNYCRPGPYTSAALSSSAVPSSATDKKCSTGNSYHHKNLVSSDQNETTETASSAASCSLSVPSSATDKKCSTGNSYYHKNLVSSDQNETTETATSAASCLLSVPSSAAEKARFTSPLHDRKLLSDEEVVLGEDGTTKIDISETVTSLIRKHEGPVRSFRIDSSRWTDRNCLDEWLQLLSEKSVQKLELFNLGHEVTTIFPIQNLQSKSLRVLRIGFLSLNLDLFCFDYSSLRILDLFCCALESIKLSWVVTDCVSLKVLSIQYCCVDLKIKSKSLESLYSVGNIGNRIVIESAPKLLSLVTGMLPRQQSVLARQRIQASISISNVPSLKFIQSVMLSFHKMTLNCVDIAKGIGMLHSVQGLQVHLEMSDSSQLQRIRKMLESFPMLQELCIVHMDSIAPEEGLNIIIDQPFEDFDMVNCVKKCLKTFSILDFRGGPSEKDMIRCILKNASNLVELSTSRSESSSKKCVRQAIREIKMYDQISGSCKLTFE